MRKTWKTPGGVHPAQNKQQSLQTPIRPAGIPAELVFPLSQHIGAPAQPVVSVGERVLKGQQIARANGFVSVPVHASSSGEVIAIEARPIAHPSGFSAPCIVIKTDGQDEWIEHKGIADYTRLDKPALIELIRNAGIAGMGGAGFPSAVKLNTRPDQIIQTLVINGTECEPYITADDMLMRERTSDIIEGIKILQHIVQPANETLIGIEDNKPEAIAALKQAAIGTSIEVVPFATKYPSGGEKQLIQILTGKEVPSGGLPAQVGVVCQNIGTTAAIYAAVVHGEPLISRITTLTGKALKEQFNVETLLGTPMYFLLEMAGFDESNASRLVMGGPMMGIAVTDTRAPVVKTSNCLLAPTLEEIPLPPTPQACIRCGMCAEACPVSLLPQQLYWYAQAKDYDRLKNHNLFDCIECGACSFACPSNIPLVQFYRASKADIKTAQEEQTKSEHSRLRFEARQARLEREEQEKEAKRKARQEAAKTKAAAKTDGEAAGCTPDEPIDDPIQAAVERAKAKAAAKPHSSEQETDPLLLAQQKVQSLEKRLATAQTKLAQAEADNSDKLEAFRLSVNKLQDQLDSARQTLSELDSSQVMG